MTSAGSTALRALAALLTISFIGCGKSSGVPVRGHVTYRGETIAKGSVTFFPKSGRPVTAVLSPSGEYSVELPPGGFDVVINVGVELPPGWKEGDPVPKQTNELPAKYTVRARSTLTATVAENQSEPIDFALE